MTVRNHECLILEYANFSKARFFQYCTFVFVGVLATTKPKEKAGGSGSEASFSSLEMQIDPVPSFDSAEATGGGGVQKEGESDAEFAARLDNTIADAGNMVTAFLGTSGES